MTSEQLDDLEHLARTSGRKLHPDKALALIARVRELEADRDRLAAEVERLARERDDLAQEILDRSETCKGHTRSADRDRDEARRQRDDAMMRAEQAEAALATTNRVLDNRMARLLEAEADRDRLAAEVERLKVALRNVLAHTAYTVPREGSLTDLLAGLLASIERITNAALAEAPTPTRTHVFDRPTQGQ